MAHRSYHFRLHRLGMYPSDKGRKHQPTRMGKHRLDDDLAQFNVYAEPLAWEETICHQLCHSIDWFWYDFLVV